MKCECVRIGELADRASGSFKIGPFGSSLKKGDLVASGIPVAGIENVFPNRFEKGFRRFISKEKFEDLRDYEIQPQDVLVTTMGTIGRAAVAPEHVEKSIIDSHLFRMRLDKTKVLPRYLCYALNSELVARQLARNSRGAIMDGLNTTILRECEIPLPPLAEQRRIAAQLEQADRLRRTRRYTLDLSDTFLPATFRRMFGTLDRLASNVKIEPLGKYLEFVTSGARGWAEHYTTAGSRFIRSLDVRMNEISDSDAVYVDAPKGAEADRTRIQTDDVLLTITGSQIGRVAPVPPKLNGAHVSQHVAILRLKAGLLPVFASTYLSLPDGGQREIERLQYGQTKPGLNFDQIHEFRIPVPSPAHQQTFATVVREHERLRSVQRESLRQAEHLFQTLLHRAFAA